MLGREGILFHKHNQELEGKSMDLVFFPLFPANIFVQKRTVEIIILLVQPPTYRTINQHLTPFTFFYSLIDWIM